MRRVKIISTSLGFGGQLISLSPIHCINAQKNNSIVVDSTDKETTLCRGQELIQSDEDTVHANMMMISCRLTIQSKNIGIEDTVCLIFMYQNRYFHPSLSTHMHTYFMPIFYLTVFLKY